MDSNRVHFPLHLRDVDVEFVIDLTVSDIVEISEFLRTMHVDLRHLPAAESSWLGKGRDGAESAQN